METADFEIADSDTADHADNNIPYACLSDLDSVISKLQKEFQKIFGWIFSNNSYYYTWKESPNRDLQKGLGSSRHALSKVKRV